LAKASSHIRTAAIRAAELSQPIVTLRRGLKQLIMHSV
jgi:hypothetical protein